MSNYPFDDLHEPEQKHHSSKSALSDLLSRFRIAFDKRRRAGDSMYSQRAFGRFRVIYKDGHSQPFDYASAKLYAERFDGKVIHKATGREC